MIPAPNLATEAPGGGAAAAAPAGGDTYGSPQAAPVGGGGAAPDSYSGPDSYNAQPAPAPSDYSSALPAAPQAPRQENPFISQYNNAAPLPVIENNDLSGQFVEEADAYGAPAGGDVAPEPITDIDTPEGGEVVITGDFDVDVEGRAPVVLTEGEDLVEECTTGDVVDVAVGAGSFTTLAKIVTDLGLVDTLKSVEAVTIFAPTDDAFAALPKGLLAGLTQDEVAAVVSRHVVAGATVMAADVATGEVETYGGEMIGLIKTEDGGVQISYDGQIVNVVTADIKACNGVIHVIDAVIVGGGSEESFGQPEASDNTDSDSDYEYEYYYDYEEDYEVDPEQKAEDLQDTYSPAYASGGGSPATEAAPLTTAGDPAGGIIEEVVPLLEEEEGEANFISVPLMIEEVSDQDAAPVILAGTSGDQLLSSYGGGDNKLNSKRRAPHAFHPVFQGWNLNTASDQNSQSKRQSDWSQRVASARRNRVWRQFNLD